MAETTQTLPQSAVKREAGFVRAIGLFDGTMIVVGSMIGSGIFIVAADISKQTGSPAGLLLTWVITGLLTISAALSYGELAGMFPHAGGQYIYLREAYSPLWGFLYGWTLFLVIQTGTIAAVVVGFAKYLGELVPSISPTTWILPPIALGSKYAISLSLQQLVAIVLVILLTFLNTLGVRLGKLIQNIFTSAKTLSLAGLILICVLIGRRASAIADNFGHFWTIRGADSIAPGAGFLAGLVPTINIGGGAFAALVAYGVAQTGSLFSADAWNNIGFTAAEVKNPKRDVALSMAFGTAIVMVLYLLANVGYLCVMPFAQIQNAPDGRVATAALSIPFGSLGAGIMAVAILISTFGCSNGLILAGARVVYAMAHDRLFFRSTGKLNTKGVPGTALVLQGMWVAILVLLRTRNPDGTYGNLYNDLLNYVVFAVLLFYVLTILGIARLRAKRPDVERPYKAMGYPVLPFAYILAASAIMFVLLLYQTKTAGAGLVIVLIGIPVYWLWSRRRPIEAGT